MSVRRRTWTNRSGKHEAWIVDYFDAGGVRRNATLSARKRLMIMKRRSRNKSAMAHIQRRACRPPSPKRLRAG